MGTLELISAAMASGVVFDDNGDGLQLSIFPAELDPALRLDIERRKPCIFRLLRERKVEGSVGLGHRITTGEILNGKDVSRSGPSANSMSSDLNHLALEILDLDTLSKAEIASLADNAPGGITNIQAICPLSTLQEVILSNERRDSGNGSICIQKCFTVGSRQELQAYIGAFHFVVRRDDALRTQIVTNVVSVPVQVVLRHVNLGINFTVAEGEQQALDIVDNLKPTAPSIPLTDAPLLRLEVVEDVANSLYHILLCVHRLICDDIALEVLLKDVLVRPSRRNSKLANIASPPKFSSHALLQRESFHEPDDSHKILGDTDESTFLFGLSKIRNGQKTSKLEVVVSDELSTGILTTAISMRMSPASLFHAAWGMVASASSGHDSVAFGSSFYGKPKYPNTGKQVSSVGNNIILIRLDLADRNVLDYLHDTDESIKSSLSYAQLKTSMAQARSRLDGDLPLFNSVLTYRHLARDRGGRGSNRVDQSDDEGKDCYEQTDFPITVLVEYSGKGFTITADVDERVNVERVTGYLLTAIEKLVDAVSTSPRVSVKQLSVLPEPEIHTQMVEWNNTKSDSDADCCAHTLIESQVSRSPEAIALIFGERRLTYGQLNAQANQLAHYLIAERKIKPGTLVGILVERSIEMVISILGVLKAGGAYVPLDPEFPEARLEYMLDDAQLNTILTLQRFAGASPPNSEGYVYLDDPETRRALKGYPTENQTCANVQAHDLAYVMYTSGSTGKPKGVMVEHRSLVNRIDWMHRQYGCDSRDAIFQKTPYSFDVSVWEFIWPLISGARLIIAKPGGHKDPQYLVETIQKYGITKVHFVPSMLSAVLVGNGLTECRSLRQVFCSGEALLSSHVSAFLNSCQWATLHNLYGPTEAAIDVSHWACEQTENLVPIGRPIQNTELYVLNEHLQPVPIGVSGGLYIGGIALARGYLNRPELTKEKFIFHTLFDASAEPTRLYKTGDVARWRDDGVLEYLGRNDNQVKIRGVRIELGEIENQLMKMELVKEVAVVCKALSNPRFTSSILIAYVVVDRINKTNIDANNGQIYRHLKENLPSYMIPSIIQYIDVLPLNFNGKVDRSKLPTPILDGLNSEVYEPPCSLIEHNLCKIWQELLEVSPIGVNDNFFSIGGDSIQAQLLLIRMRKFGYRITISEFYRYQTVRELAKNIGLCSEANNPENGESLAVFEATSLQKKMLIQTFMNRSKEVYTEQVVLQLDAYCEETMQNTLLELTSRNRLLNAKVSLDGGGVYFDTENQHDLNFQEITVEKFFDLNDAIRQDAEEGFDIFQGPLFRVRVYIHNRKAAKVLFSFHHSIVDGWSLGNFVDAFLGLYNNKAVPIGEPLQFGSYVSALHRLSESQRYESRRFWHSHLAEADLGSGNSCAVLVESRSNLSTYEYYESPLGFSVFTQIKSYAKMHLVSVNAILQYAWARVLCQLGGMKSADFLQAVSIRPAHISNIDQLIGLCINIVPTHIRSGYATDDVIEIRQVDMDNQGIIAYGYESIEDIRRYANLSAKYEENLWSLIVYQNYPEFSTAASRHVIKSRWYSSHPLTIMIFADDQPRMEAIYSTRYFSNSDVSNMLDLYVKELSFLVRFS